MVSIYAVIPVGENAVCQSVLKVLRECKESGKKMLC